jgi:hypothetical protein
MRLHIEADRLPSEVEGALSLMRRHLLAFTSAPRSRLRGKHAQKAQKHLERARRYLRARGGAA